MPLLAFYLNVLQFGFESCCFYYGVAWFPRTSWTPVSLICIPTHRLYGSWSDDFFLNTKTYFYQFLIYYYLHVDLTFYLNKFRWHRPSESGEDDKHVNSLRLRSRLTNDDDKNDRIRTNVDQKAHLLYYQNTFYTTKKNTISIIYIIHQFIKKLLINYLSCLRISLLFSACCKIECRHS